MTTQYSILHRLFMDTGAYAALASSRDEHHQEALSIRTRMLEERYHPFTTNLILAETHALLLSKAGRATALRFLSDIDASTTTTIVRVSTADERRAREILRQYDDKNFSLTDCTSFAVMERLHIATAFTFDHNFNQYGLTVLEAR